MRIVRAAVLAATVTPALVLFIGAPVFGHVVSTEGSYTVALGWLHEPTYVGEQNAVQVVIKDSGGQPVTDLSPDDLKVVVIAAMEQSDALPLAASYDEDTGLGTPGEYLAPIIPTTPGDYTFHLTGNIHDQAVDETATSSDSTFDSVADATPVQFPVKVPSVTELATRIDRVDSRESSDASNALIVGVAVGGAGVLIGLVALGVAWRSRRTVRA